MFKNVGNKAICLQCFFEMLMQLKYTNAYGAIFSITCLCSIPNKTQAYTELIIEHVLTELIIDRPKVYGGILLTYCVSLQRCAALNYDPNLCADNLF